MITNENGLCLLEAIVTSKDFVFCGKVRTEESYEFQNFIRDGNSTLHTEIGIKLDTAA